MPFSTDVGDLFGPGGISYVNAADQDVWHRRRQARAFLFGRFRNAALTGRVRSEPRAPFNSRPDQRELPAINLFTLDEQASVLTKESFERELSFIVDVLAEGVGECVLSIADFKALEDQPMPVCPCVGCKLDQYALVVEALLEIEKLDQDEAKPLVVSTQLVSSVKVIEERGDRRFGSIRLTYLITYTTSTGVFWPD